MVAHASNISDHIHSAYTEAAYFVLDFMQVAARFDFLYHAFGSRMRTNRHSEAALGVNFWISRNVVFRLNYYWVYGNFYARPDDSAVFDAAVADQTLQTQTHVLSLGAAFSF